MIIQKTKGYRYKNEINRQPFSFQEWISIYYLVFTFFYIAERSNCKRERKDVI